MVAILDLQNHQYDTWGAGAANAIVMLGEYFVHEELGLQCVSSLLLPLFPFFQPTSRCYDARHRHSFLSSQPPRSLPFFHPSILSRSQCSPIDPLSTFPPPPSSSRLSPGPTPFAPSASPAAAPSSPTPTSPATLPPTLPQPSSPTFPPSPPTSKSTSVSPSG
jgi:hypothetical protein